MILANGASSLTASAWTRGPIALDLDARAVEAPRHGRGFPHSGGRMNLSGASAAAFELPPWPR
jgi:hypothetical protein